MPALCRTCRPSCAQVRTSNQLSDMSTSLANAHPEATALGSISPWPQHLPISRRLAACRRTASLCHHRPEFMAGSAHCRVLPTWCHRASSRSALLHGSHCCSCCFMPLTAATPAAAAAQLLHASHCPSLLHASRRPPLLLLLHTPNHCCCCCCCCSAAVSFASSLSACIAANRLRVLCQSPVLLSPRVLVVPA
jgi:hypothetical protein